MSKVPLGQDDLRKAAEAQLGKVAAAPIRPADEFLHELQAHQIELEMQNEALIAAQIALEASRDHFVDFYESSPVGYLTLTDTGLIADINLTGAALLGAERGKLLQQPFAGFVSPDDADRWHLHLVSVLKRDGKLNCDLALHPREGIPPFVRLDSLRLIKDGQAPTVRVVLTDITERKEMGLSIARQHQLLQDVVENLSFGLVVFAKNRQIILSNSNLSTILDLPSGFFDKRNVGFDDIIRFNFERGDYPDQSFESVLHRFVVLLEAGKPVSFERDQRNGSWLEIRGNPLHDGGNVLTYSDITGRKQAEFAIRNLARAVEQSPISVVITDRAGNIEYVNPQFEKQTGYAMPEVLGRNPGILKSGRTPAETYREMWHTISAGGEWRGELCNRKKDGELLWESAAISAIKDENGQVTHFVSVQQDIGERKQAAEAVWQARRREIEIGSTIQRTLLQGNVPGGIEGAWLATHADPSQIIDGDFYTIRRYRPACFELLVGDVMGKGVPAALIGAGILTSYSNLVSDLLVAGSDAQTLPTPAQIVNAMHRVLTPELIKVNTFATLALYRFDLDAGTLTYVNAGHTPGLLTRESAPRPVAILGDNLPIGVIPEEEYVQSSIAVGPGDRLLIYSDGITESLDEADEEFGLERLSGLFEAGSRADLPPATLLQSLRGELRRYNGGRPLTDDQTALVVALHERRVQPRGQIADRVKPFVFDLPWCLDELASLPARIGERAGHLLAEDADALILASFEAATNIIRHARLLIGDATITCRITREDEALAVELFYPSEAFSPPANLQPDFSGVSEGGFGLYTIEQSVDSVEYGNPMPGISSVRMVKRASAVAA